MGMSREEFYSSTLGGFRIKLEGFMLLETEIRNIGHRRTSAVIVNALGSLGGGREITEHKFWPMSLDNVKPVPKSEELIEKDKELIERFWPDVKWQR